MALGIIVVGAGGHAKVCIELLRAMGEPVDYCIGTSVDPSECVGVPVLQGDHHLQRLHELGYDRVFIAIGANMLREKLAMFALAQGYRLMNAISPFACVSPTAQLGQGIAIMAGAVVNAEASIGDFSIINTGATVDHDTKIGVATHIAPQCALAGNVRVGKFSVLGIGARVIPDVSIGEKVTIGAGSVVIASIPHGVTAVGVPAKIIKAATDE